MITKKDRINDFTFPPPDLFSPSLLCHEEEVEGIGCLPYFVQRKNVFTVRVGE